MEWVMSMDVRQNQRGFDAAQLKTYTRYGTTAHPIKTLSLIHI